MQKSSVEDCKLVDLPVVHNVSGNITAINNGDRTLPFEVKRVYYLYDIPGGESRGAHAHKQLQQLIVAASGSFDITVDDGKIKKTFSLSRPYKGLYLPPGLWREIDNFSSGSICLVLASDVYREDDYIRDQRDFVNYKNVRFTEYDKTFLDLSWQWLNDPEIKKLTMTADFTKEDQLVFFKGLAGRTDYLINGVVYNGHPIGVCGLKHISSSEAEYWGYIGEKDYWGMGIGQFMLAEMVARAKSIGLNELYLTVDPNNQRAVSSYKKFGFKPDTSDDVLKMRFIL